MNKNILTIEDLYDFYSTHKNSVTFSAEKNGYNVSVITDGRFSLKEENPAEGLLYCNIKAFHDLSNKNRTYIETEIMKEKLSTMKDRPIMARIIETNQLDDNGEPIKDFSSHGITYDEDKDKLIYSEIPVGHFVNPDSFTVEYDEEYDRNFVLGECVLYEEYTDACDILRRKGETDCSIELIIKDMVYSAKTKCLMINDFYVQGCTLLGNGIKPGMKGSKVTLKDFSERNNSFFAFCELNNKVTDTLDKINETLVNFSSNINRKEETEQVTKDNTNTDIATNQELKDGENLTPAVSNENPVSDNTNHPVAANQQSEEPYIRTFEISHEDIRYSLYHLIENPNLDQWCYIEQVFDNYCVYKSYNDDLTYGQKYTVNQDDNTVALDGEPFRLYSMYLTEEEKNEVETSRKKIAELSAIVSKYQEVEENEAKAKIFAKESYAPFLECNSFKELKNKAPEYSVKDLETACKLAFAECVEAAGSYSLPQKEVEKPAKAMFSFAANEQPTNFLDKFLKK